MEIDSKQNALTYCERIGQEAADCYDKLADCHIKLDSVHEAASAMSSAAGCIKKADPKSKYAACVLMVDPDPDNSVYVSHRIHSILFKGFRLLLQLGSPSDGCQISKGIVSFLLPLGRAF